MWSTFGADLEMELANFSMSAATQRIHCAFRTTAKGFTSPTQVWIFSGPKNQPATPHRRLHTIRAQGGLQVVDRIVEHRHGFADLRSQPMVMNERRSLPGPKWAAPMCANTLATSMVCTNNPSIGNMADTLTSASSELMMMRLVHTRRARRR